MDGRSAAKAILEIAEIAGIAREERERIRGNAVALAQRFDREKLARFVESTLNALVKNESLPASSGLVASFFL